MILCETLWCGCGVIPRRQTVACALSVRGLPFCIAVGTGVRCAVAVRSLAVEGMRCVGRGRWEPLTAGLLAGC